MRPSHVATLITVAHRGVGPAFARCRACVELANDFADRVEQGLTAAPTGPHLIPPKG